jgi:hypothetical protein
MIPFYLGNRCVQVIVKFACISKFKFMTRQLKMGMHSQETGKDNETKFYLRLINNKCTDVQLTRFL